MKKFFTTLLFSLLCTAMVHADVPFRNHRYDAFKVLKVSSDNIVFVGNSITNMHEWWEAFDNHKILNRGNSGGYTDEILNNIESYIEGKPAKMFLMIGTNDLGTAGINNPAYVAGKIRAIVRRVKTESPATELYVQSILPSQSDLRTLPVLKETNDSIRNICTEQDVTYIDLWDDLMGITSGNALSLDGLHLKATGYQIWCSKIAPYVGSECAYLNDAAVNNQTGGLGGSYGMRVSCFGASRVKDGDVLMIGDEMIHGGEWHELLHCGKVKARGNGWGYSGVNIAQISSSINAILKGRSDNGEPSKIFLYAGVADVNGTATLETIKTNYEALVEQTRALAPNARIYLLSLLPRNDAASNTNRIAPFNELLSALAAAKNNVEFVDIYTPILGSGNAANSDYVTQNYLYGKGYAKLSQIIAPLLAEEGAKGTTDEEAAAQINLLAARTRLGNALTQMQAIGIGNSVGQYPETAAQPVINKIEEIRTLLTKNNATVAEIDALAETCVPAIQEILSAINQPSASHEGDEHWYTFCSSLRGSRYMTGSKGSSVLIGGDKTNFATTWWKLTERTDGSFDIINRETGKYISPDAAYNRQIQLTSEQPSAGWTFSYSDTPGMYIISSGNVQLNQTNSNGAIYNWSSGQNGTDRSDLGCQFTITETTGEPTPNNELETGWYKIKVATGSDATMQSYVSNGTNQLLNANEEFRQSLKGTIYYYPLRIGATDEAKPASAFIHVTKGTGVHYIQGLNGHFVQENCTATREQPTNNAVIATSTANPEYFTIGKWSYYNPGSGEQPYVGKSSNSNHTFIIQRIEDEELASYRQYTVSINGTENSPEIGNDPSVTCTNSANAGIAKVYDSGYYFFPETSLPVPEDFTPSTVEGLVATIEVGEHNITVTYMPASIDGLVEEAETALSLTGVGYPSENSTARTALRQAIEAAQSAGVTAASVSALKSAIEAYKSESTDIQMPEDGKAYAFLNIQLAAADRYLTYVDEATGLATEEKGDAVPANATFVCHKLESGKYVFVNPAGKFLIFRGSNDGPEGNKGYINAYAENTADFTFIRPTLANKQNVATGVTDADFFGCVSFSAPRTGGSLSNFIIKSDGSFDQAGTTIFYNNSYSNVFKVEEISYYNQPEFTSIENEGWSTLYLPFATTIPAGVTAYAGNLSEGALTLAPVEGDILPANTAVLLKGSVGTHTFAPSTSAGTPVEGNAFWGTMDASAETPALTYAFGATNDRAAFGKYDAATLEPAKAYLTGTSDEVEAYYIHPATSIDEATTGNNTPAAIYDLGGRRVTKPSRGIYVQGGKKLILR